MKKINTLYECDYNFKVNEIKNNSKEVKKNDIFVCTKGVNKDRYLYIDEAIKNKASCLILKKPKIPFFMVDNPNDELGKLSKKLYDDPLKNKTLIGVTGTDGKTSTATIISEILDQCSYIGTNGVYYKNKKIKTNNTTPEINELYKYFNIFNKNDINNISMEVSSEALLHNRVNTLEFDRVIFTNITEDHLNVHKTIKNYINCKLKILEKMKRNSILIINRDDKYYKKIKSKARCKILTYGKNKKSDLLIRKTSIKKNKTIIEFSFLKNTYFIESPLLGEFNVYNLCASILCAFSLGYSFSYINKKINKIYVPGRCEVVDLGQNYTVILDYAHTENGLKEILKYLNSIKEQRIITVTGSAGGREKENRKRKGFVVQDLSDLVIYTMDDPRYENVKNIINDMINIEKNNYLIIEDREKAIKKALSIANSFDIVLIAGKGRDNYMAIKNKKIKYSDYKIITKYLKKN